MSMSQNLLVELLPHFLMNMTVLAIVILEEGNFFASLNHFQKQFVFSFSSDYFFLFRVSNTEFHCFHYECT